MPRQVTTEPHPASSEGGQCCSHRCHLHRCRQQRQGAGGLGRKPCSRGCRRGKCLFPTGSTNSNTWCFPVTWFKLDTFSIFEYLDVGEILENFESTGFNIKISSFFHGLMEPVVFHLNSEHFGPEVNCFFQVLGSEAFSDRIKAPFGGTAWRCSAYEEISMKYSITKVVNVLQNLSGLYQSIEDSTPRACGSFRGRCSNFFQLFVQEE